MVSLRGRKGVAESPLVASSAAFLILIITILLIFYILFLPPSDRAALLGDNQVPGSKPSVSGGYNHLVGTIPLQENVGQLTYIRDATVEHPLASMYIYTQTDANVIAQANNVEIQNSAYDTKDHTMRFTIDRVNTENLVLSFNVLQTDGALRIYLNGERIHDAALPRGTPTPITLPTHLLKNDNILHFSVSSPGFAFWTVNKYELSGITVTGDVTDESNAAHSQNIYLSQTEKDHAVMAELRFFPDCSHNNVGPLRMSLNGVNLFEGVPDCGLINILDVNTDLLQEGRNRLTASSQQGSYIIDQLRLDVDLDDPGYPIYYFDLSEDLFVSTNSGQTYCGKIDGICPTGCESYEDKDCCFDESSSNYWCDVKPNNPKDRCVNQVLASYANNCPSGYEDRFSDPHDEVEGKCGDDTDGYCPSGCSATYDKDCCYLTSGNFWCDDVPLTGQGSVCTQSVTVAECNACPDGYEDDDGDAPNCPVKDITQLIDDGDELKSGVDVVVEVYFASDTFNRIDLLVNGYTIPVDTYNREVFRSIEQYIHEGTNSLEIKPRKDTTISQVRVVIE